MPRAWTAEEIRALGVRTDLETAASIWGIGRTRAYELARAGEFPCRVLRIGAKYVVLVTPMLRALGIEDDTEPETPVVELRQVAEAAPAAPGPTDQRRGPPAA